MIFLCISLFAWEDSLLNTHIVFKNISGKTEKSSYKFLFSHLNFTVSPSVDFLMVGWHISKFQFCNKGNANTNQMITNIMRHSEFHLYSDITTDLWTSWLFLDFPMKNKNKSILGNGHHSIEPQSPSVPFLCINDNKSFGPTVKIHLLWTKSSYLKLTIRNWQRGIGTI